MRIARGISIANISKPISTAIVYDADAVTFFTAASITDITQKSAVNTLVLNLKSANIWAKMKALYPVVGGVASSHAVNLKTPGTYNLTFQVGWTHSSNGMTPNGATYANTSLVPSTVLTTSSAHASFYSRTSISGLYDMGVASSSITSSFFILIRDSSNVSYYNCGNYNVYPSVSNTNGQGMYITNRNSTTNTTGYKNGNLVVNTIQGSGLPSYNMFISGLNLNGAPSAGNYGNKQCAFASIGNGLTDAEATNFYNAVQTYQTTLGRQV